MTRVLVPTDFSDRAGRAARWAHEAFPDAEVRLLHVVDPLTLHAPSTVAPGGGYALSGDGLDLQRDFEFEVQGRLRRLGGGELVVGHPGPGCGEDVRVDGLGRRGRPELGAV